MDTYWLLERAHRMMEKSGAIRQQRVFADQIAGIPAIFTTSFDGEKMLMDDCEFLPARLAGPLARLSAMREAWLDVLPTTNPLRQYNIVVAQENLEKMTKLLRRNAIHCQGTRYLLISVVDIICCTMQKIANYPDRVDGVVEDEIFGTAALRISELLRNANCGYRAA